MEIVERKLQGVYEITLDPILDQRGFFMRTFDLNQFNGYGINKLWVQENQSRTEHKGVVRGLHFQLPPYSETKLVRCIHGSIWDVFVDLRKSSPTFAQWDTIELSNENTKMILIPRGFAHGFCTLSDECEVTYKVDNFYSKEHERGIIWNDINLGINWPIQHAILSDKDNGNWTFKEFLDEVKELNV